MYLQIDPARIVATGEQLRARIRERFPDASLARIADELVAVARAHAARSEAIRRPSHTTRLVGTLVLLALVALFVWALQTVHPEVGDRWQLYDLLQAVESALGTLVFLGAGFAFVWTLDVRAKRRRCLHALHEMRAMAHIVDMHQLTKDPDRLLRDGTATKSSPRRTMARFELSRYLDYCSEMLSLIGKVAALYVQGFPDPVALQAVDDIETLTTGLSRKIWQKIVILDQGGPGAGAPAPAAAPAVPPTPAAPAEDPV